LEGEQHGCCFSQNDFAGSCFLHPGFADKIEQFGRLLNVDQVLEIASQIFVKSLKANGNVADSDNTRGFSQLRLVLSNFARKIVR